MNKHYLTAALVADSLSLGVHWIYDTEQLERQYGRVQGFLEPAVGSYHHGQPKGGQTHLGHQVIVLSQALSKATPFADELKQFWKTSESYQDHATKNFLTGSGQLSGELAGASRIGAVVAHFDSYDNAAPAMREQILLTHNQEVVEAGDKLLQLFFLLTDGQDIPTAVSSIFEGSSSYQKAQEVLSIPPTEAIAKLGQSCTLSSGLPSVLYLLLKAKDYREAMIDNVVAGGDSASRGLALGPLFVAHFGAQSIPKDWSDGLQYQVS